MYVHAFVYVKCDMYMQACKPPLIHVHAQVVLAGYSPYLRAMFTNGMLESGRDVVDIHGIESDTMELLLDFMYTCSIVISVENVQRVLQGASLLGLTSLRNMCAHFLQSHLTPSNCLGKLALLAVAPLPVQRYG